MTGRATDGERRAAQFLPPIGTFYGTAPKPSLDTIHKAIFGFNAEGSKLMPEAMAPAPAAKAATMGRRLQQTAHDETVRPTPCACAGLALMGARRALHSWAGRSACLVAHSEKLSQE